jgi:UDP-N-acetylglucosamine 2-epimerase (non-hydrolysing)
MQVTHIVGARPNFMKVAPVLAGLAQHNRVEQRLVHTGQHYDKEMSEIFFEQLGLPKPNVNLEAGSGSHAVQTAQIMIRLEEVLLAKRPDLVLIYGDVNSTIAAALVCAKLQIPVGHVEAGLRSKDRTMPEEINRLLTDQLSDLLFTPSPDGNENLRREGIATEKVHLVGNVMIDTLQRLLPVVEARWPHLRAEMQLCDYGLVTLHRPSNVDVPATLEQILITLDQISHELPIVFPIHPRTRRQIETQGLTPLTQHLRLINPLGYLDFLALENHAALVITDSGGVQEETTYLRIPCLTLRANTERPITVTTGTNILVGQDLSRLRREAAAILQGQAKVGAIPALWDGHAGARIADIIVKYLQK